jgi:F-type H+-transporting ATPase subunit b
MPQFDFTHVFLPQVVWLAGFFAILYFGVVRFTLPRLGRVMQAREDRVSGDLDSAEAAKLESERLAAAYAEGLALAHQQARDRIGKARAEADKAAATRLAKSDATLQARLDSAEAALAETRRKALAEIDGLAAGMAADIVAKLTGSRPAARG